MMDNMAHYQRPRPNTPAGNEADWDITDRTIWKSEIDQFVKAEEKYKKGVQALYSLLLGQCLAGLRTKLEGRADWKTTATSRDGLELLKAIQAVVYNFDDQKYKPLALYDAHKASFMQYQSKKHTLDDYLESFTNVYRVIEFCGGNVGGIDGLVRDVYYEEYPASSTFIPAGGAERSFESGWNSLTAAEREKLRQKAINRFLAVAFLRKANKAEYAQALEELANDYAKGQNNYPETVSEAYTFLTNYSKDTKKHLLPILNSATEGKLQFLQNFEKKNQGCRTANNRRNGGGANQPDHSELICFICGKKGHILRNCPDKKQASNNFVEVAAVEEEEVTENIEEISTEDMTRSQEWDGYFVFAQSPIFGHAWSILLDSGSTIDIFVNAKLLTNIRRVLSSITINTNAGKVECDMMGDLAGYGAVYYHPEGIANILSLSNVVKKYAVEFCANSNSFSVKTDTGTKVFENLNNGLYVFRLESTNFVSLVNTVAEKKREYTEREVRGATLARKLHNIVGFPLLKTYLYNVDNKLIPNCPVTREDIKVAEDIFGPNLAILQGKTVRKSEEHVQTKIEPVPPEILDRYQEVTIAGDVMFVSGVAFLMTISRFIRFGTANMLKNMLMGPKNPIMKCMRELKALYQQRGFNITVAIMDLQFEPLRIPLAEIGIMLNTVAEDEHVPEQERWNRTIKERIRCLYHSLPFNQIPILLLVEMVYYVVFWWNLIPPQGGVSTVMSPRSLITGFRLDYNHHCQLEFGTYVQVHEVHDNTMRTRTTGALSMRPTGNLQGGYNFFNLGTGRRIVRNRWTSLPMPDIVIAQVNQMGRRDKTTRNLIFRMRDNETPYDSDDEDGSIAGVNDDKQDIHDGAVLDFPDLLSDDDSDYEDDESSSDDEDEDDDSEDDDDDSNNDVEPIDEEANDEGDDDTPIVYTGRRTLATQSSTEQMTPPLIEENIEPAGVPNPVGSMDQITEDEPNDSIGHEDEGDMTTVPIFDVNKEFEQRYGPRGNRYGLRQRKLPNFAP